MTSVTTPLTTWDDLADGTDLAVLVGGEKIERWQWHNMRLRKPDGTSLPPFFFSGLLHEGKILPGDFSPPVKGEWFTSQTSSDWSYLVLSDADDNKHYRCAYFRRERFYDWRKVSQGDLLDGCVRGRSPAWAGEQYVDMAVRCVEAIKAQAEAEERVRSSRTARINVAHARDYLVRALEQMERTT